MSTPLHKSTYRPVKDDEFKDDDDEVDDGSSQQSSWRFGRQQSGSFRSKHFAIANVVLFVSSLGMLGLSLFFMGKVSVRSVSTSSPACAPEDTSVYSPIFDRLPVKQLLTKVNGTFWPQNPPSLLQQRPSPEVDRVWARLTTTYGIVITEDEVRKMGKDPKKSWPWPKVDAPEGSYMGIIDIFHQVHCLDMFRRTAFPEYYGNLREMYKDELFPFDDHLLHCQYTLVQALTCHADLEVILFNKIKGLSGPFADFSVEKKCRNFDDIMAWQDAHQIKPQGNEYKETPDGIEQIDGTGNAFPWSA
ncbi:hypothetical protein EJ06DRAFT_228265 [Trichodelitschia bisporula]|uniref:Tat pathway signal sequence n=1 Tax=Trichodelitschia bisporula TaxID=703511 RepID=A0A6G1HLD4_9PEZI|nr:hypothetical protein EJ06DRAFT_228265 [Trichodelitschia bisporula]